MRKERDGMSLLSKIAIGNVRRNLNDFGVYFAALAAGACLMYSYAASGDYLFKLVTDESVRGLFVAEANYSLAFGILPLLVFLNVASYANKFLIRRRLPEFALYELAGLEKRNVTSVLRLETAIVAGSALAAGLILGVLISPFVEMIVAWAYRLPVRFVMVFSPLGTAVTIVVFVLTILVLSRGSRRVLRKSTLLRMMSAKKESDSSKPISVGRAIMDLIFGVALVSVVYVVCANVPVAFLGLMIPLGACAIFGSFFIFRATLVLLPRLIKHIPVVWYRGLTAFTVRQTEGVARNASKAMTCSAALSSVGMCMFVFAVVLHDQIGVMAFAACKRMIFRVFLVRLSSRARFMRLYFWSLLRSFWQYNSCRWLPITARGTTSLLSWAPHRKCFQRACLWVCCLTLSCREFLRSFTPSLD